MSWAEKVLKSDAGRISRDAAQRLIDDVGEGEPPNGIPTVPRAPLLAPSPAPSSKDDR